MGMVGFLDDFIKIYKQRSLGLRSKAKMVGQTLVAVVFGLLALSPMLEDDNGRTPASLKVSFLREIDWLVLPTILAIALIWLIVTATSNAVNLADGLDGLATGASVMVFGAYTLVNIWQNNQFCQEDPSATCYNVRDPLDLAVIAAAITGACFGFLWWNASPAAIFMGDTGSLALGGALAGFAILTRTELLLIIIGGMFVLETVSVMLQVTWFKATKRVTGVGRRIFRIAPIHHHFENLGWEQVTVVIRFWIITGLFVASRARGVLRRVGRPAMNPDRSRTRRTPGRASARSWPGFGASGFAAADNLTHLGASGHRPRRQRDARAAREGRAARDPRRRRCGSLPAPPPPCPTTPTWWSPRPASGPTRRC